MRFKFTFSHTCIDSYTKVFLFASKCAVSSKKKFSFHGKWSETPGWFCVRATQTSFLTVTIISTCSSVETYQVGICYTFIKQRSRAEALLSHRCKSNLMLPIFQSNITRSWENQGDLESQYTASHFIKTQKERGGGEEKKKKKAFRQQGFPKFAGQTYLSKQGVKS